MLMDKTLGAPSVVTEDNLPQLFQEMLHPHLEEERKKGDQAVLEEKERGKRKFEEVRGELQLAKKAESDTAAMLQATLREDREIVNGLCGDVETALAKRRTRKKIVGVGLAIIFCVPPILLPSIWQTYISIAFALPLAYLTIVGSRLIGIATTKKNALSVLSTTAKERHLSAKLSRFNIDWRGKRFSVLDPSGTPANDLFAASEARPELYMLD